ncbi:MAG: hypothetical protein WC461_00905 [Candidatus Paceibacterota bacterium]
MKNKISKSLIIAVIGVFAVVSAFVWQKIQTFVNKGLTDSQKIRIADNSNQSELNSPKFNGCNSII